MMTKEGLLNFINRDPPPEGEPEEWMLKGIAWLEDHVEDLSKVHFPVMWTLTIEGVWHIFRKETLTSEVEEIAWIEDPEMCTMKDLEERK